MPFGRPSSPSAERRGKTPTPFPPHTRKANGAAELVSYHVIPVYKLWVVKKKKVGAIPLALTRGQQRLKGKKNMGEPGQPLTVKYKKKKKKCSPTQRPPRANKHKPQAPVTSFERLSFVRLRRLDDDPPYFALISGSLFHLF